MKNLKLIKPFMLVLGATLILSACTNEELAPSFGCMETDALNYDGNATISSGDCAFASKKVIGEWRADLWKLKGTDFVCSGFALNYDFQEDGHFEYTFIGDVIPSFTGHGKWGMVGEVLKLDYDGKGINWRLASTFYNMQASNEENFKTNFGGDPNQFNLGIYLEDVSLDISFSKKRNRPIDKDDF